MIFLNLYGVESTYKFTQTLIASIK